MQIRPITDLRDTNKISEICHAENEPVYITKNGYGDMVIMSIETFEEYINQAAVDYAIAEAEKEFQESGKLLNAEDALSSLRRKYLG